ncbi:hypothetical protein [Ruegeria aquimaris]|uniref:Secreted protein n=1 Tax=Ruegeria aquimaris TaxID=2984333 RepID=A0ABT3AK42_9RHOB|nr:hypothetical protein [Ruegeria sp. XHP0148]MCV2889009.1 hypothetical protein [Ruegeria sp. XHP0148]
MRIPQVKMAVVLLASMTVVGVFSDGSNAQSNEGSSAYGGGGVSRDSALSNIAAWTPVNAATTGRIVKALNSAAEFCRSKADRAFVLDCMNYEYWQIVNALPKTGEYAEVRVALEGAAKNMSALVKRHGTQTSAKTLSRGGSQPKTTTRKIAPVPASAVSTTARQAANAIAEAQTVLLRSTGNSDLRRVQFQRIAQAMDSGAILLRSL